MEDITTIENTGHYTLRKHDVTGVMVWDEDGERIVTVPLAFDPMKHMNYVNLALERYKLWADTRPDADGLVPLKPAPVPLE